MRREQSGSSALCSARLTSRLAVLLVTTVLLTGVGAAAAQAAPAQPRAFGLPQPRVYQGGGVIGFGDARSTNTPLGSGLSSVMVGMATNPASTPENQGYWLAAADGGVFAQGNAGFYGSLGALRLQGPVVGIAPTPDGRGYWLVALDGGVFAFGDAAFYGSMGAVPPQPARGGHGRHPGRARLLAGGSRRRHLLLRRRRLLRVDGQPSTWWPR